MERRSDRFFTTEVFFEPINFNLQLTDGLVQLLGLLLAILVGFLCLVALTENIRRTVKKLSFL